MTTPAPETIEREKDKLYVLDDELIRILGLPERVGKVAIQKWEENSPTFPPKQELLGGRRYWPAVKAWLDARNGLKMDTSEAPRRERSVR